VADCGGSLHTAVLGFRPRGACETNFRPPATTKANTYPPPSPAPEPESPITETPTRPPNSRVETMVRRALPVAGHGPKRPGARTVRPAPARPAAAKAAMTASVHLAFGAHGDGDNPRPYQRWPRDNRRPGRHGVQGK